MDPNRWVSIDPENKAPSVIKAELAKSGFAIGRAINEPGWIKIGATCSANRRSMWYRVQYEEIPLEQYQMRAIKIELCSGHEGDDHYTVLDRSNPLFDALFEIFTDAEIAAET